MDASFKNYIEIEKFSLLHDHFAFVDTREYLADQLFIGQQVRVWFGGEYQHPDQPFLIIFCKCRKRDRERFLRALSELNRKMILCGYPGYEAFCHNLLAMVEGPPRP